MCKRTKAPALKRNFSQAKGSPTLKASMEAPQLASPMPSLEPLYKEDLLQVVNEIKEEIRGLRGEMQQNLK